MKVCTKCRRELPVTKYAKHRGGLAPSCKECKRIDQQNKVAGWRGPVGRLNLPEGTEI